MQIESIQGFEGDVDKLGNAEKFFHALLNLKSYKIRIEIMLLKADFNSQIGAVRPNVQVLNSVCRKLIDNKSLKSFLRYVLHAGNFINKVSHIEATYMNLIVVQIRKLFGNNSGMTFVSSP